MQSSSVHRAGPTHHSIYHIITEDLNELSRTVDRERVLKDKSVVTGLESLVRDIEMIWKVLTEIDWDNIDWGKLNGGIEILNKSKEKVDKYVASKQRPRGKEMKGGGGVCETQLEDQPPGKAEKKVKAKRSRSEKRAQRAQRALENMRQMGLLDSDSEDESDTHEVLRASTQKVKDIQERKRVDEMIDQAGIEKDKSLGPGMRPKRRVECSREFSEARDQGLQRRTFDGHQPRKDVPGQAVRTGTPGNRERSERSGKLKKPACNVSNLPKGTLYQAPLRSQTPKDQRHCHCHASCHQHGAPMNQVRPTSPGHQHPVHAIRTPIKAPDHQKQVNLNNHNSPDLHTRCTHQQLRPSAPAPRNPHKAVSHHHFHTTPSRPEPNGPAYQQTLQNQHSGPRAPIPSKLRFNEPPVNSIPSVNQTRSRSPSRESSVTHQNRPKSNTRVQKGTSHQQPTEPNDEKDPTKDPDNKVMFNKRPRVATDLKELKMQKAKDNARALASEIRKMV